MSEMTQKTSWQRYRLPICLAIVALGLYAASILWFVVGNGGAA